LFLNRAQKLGLCDTPGSGEARLQAADQPHPSDLLLQDVDLNLLSRAEQIELSQLAAIINRDGSIWVLSASELERVRELVNKGRGKDITQH
jgi:hypothetical protein